MNELNVAVIGAGPYGLSIAAHLDAAGIEHRVFGVPMESWQRNMPTGMFLKSYGESSDLYDPKSSLTLEEFCRTKGLPYHDSNVPVSLDTFVAYGTAFQERFVPRVERTRLVALAAAERGHRLTFDSGETLIARHVVLAIGVLPFKFTPPNLTHLPATLASHSSDFGSLRPLAGKEVAVVGGGASALDMAALLSKQGSKVTLISRGTELHFQSEPQSEPIGAKRLLRRMLSPTANGLGSGWLMTICGRAPEIIHALPDRARLAILNNYLGPSGGYFVRTQVTQSTTTKMGRVIEKAEEHAGRVRLSLVDLSGARETIESDHLIAATGYKIDLGKLGFLDQATVERLRTIDNTPVLSRNFESSVRGLYFVGLSSARSFGPVMRFVVGAVHPARRLARIFAASGARRPIAVAASMSN